MSIITKARLTSVTEIQLGYSNFSRSVNEVKNQSKYSAQTTIFLSHSHSDADIIDKISVLFKKTGVNIYIDRNDSGLPPTTGSETAKRLKEKIKECKKFVLVATDLAVASKWCNWELGFGDAFKFPDNIALLPLAENSATWSGTEYLKIYPRIEESNYTTDYFKVIYPDGTEISLYDWLKS
ncbi:MAG TPA: toll/interleukin-1 receptor domain-containing protein [Chryseobacterium sp.]